MDINNIDKKIEYLGKDKWYDVHDLIYKGHKFLEENGFHLKSHTENGRECTTDIEIWEKE